MIRIACPRCKERLVLDDENRGQIGQCPECSTQFRIPAGHASNPGKARPPLLHGEKEDDEQFLPPKRMKVSKKRRRPAASSNSFELNHARVRGLVCIGFGLAVITFSGATAGKGGAYGAGAGAASILAILFIIVGVVRVIKG